MDQKLIDKYLKKICEDRAFANYYRYRDLLVFIASEAVDGRYVKEFNIAIKLYGENITEDKSDGRVRVYMHNLRKKLDLYYAESGKDDEIIFVLERGSYNIKFKERVDDNNYDHCEPIPSTQQVNRMKIWGLSIVALILLAAVVLVIHRDRELYCWNLYLNSDTPTLCVLADHVIVHPKDNSVYRGIIHDNIKNMSMYYDHIAVNPKDSLEVSQYTFFSKSIPYSIHSLTKWFVKHDRDFILTPESNFSNEFIKSSNLIYLGQFKSMDSSKPIFLRGSKIFSVDNRYIYVKKDGKETKYRAKFDRQGAVIEEYALVSFAPLTENTKALYFTSNHDIGTMAVLNNFTNIDYLKGFYKQLPSPDAYFNVLFKVEGIGRTDITCAIVELEVLDDSIRNKN